jgi:hypothetical protein
MGQFPITGLHGRWPSSIHYQSGREVITEKLLNGRKSMTSIIRWSIAVAMVGLFVLILSGQTQSDVVVAQGRKPVMMYRFYEGIDGLSHVEKIEVKNFDDHDVANLMAVRGAEIRRTKPGAPGAVFSGPFHPEPLRQYVFNLLGHAQIEFSGGEKITLNPGDIELVEDTAPSKGHRNLTLGPEDRVTLAVPIADQTVVRDSILK